MIAHQIPDGVRPLGLARYLSRAWPLLPQRAIREALKKKDVRVNGARSGAEALVRGGDGLMIYLPDALFEMPLSVIHEGEGMLVVDKPQGLPVDVDSEGIGADTMRARARLRFPGAELCHRLDEGTGGALMLSLSGAAHERILAAFRDHRIEKTYQALVLGCPGPGEGTLRAHLIKDERAAKVRVVDRPIPGALPIETRCRLMRGMGEVSLVEIGLITGRTHQIRAHMAHIGHPLLGDDKYGDREANKRMHAKWPQLWCTRLVYEGRAFESEPRFVIVSAD